MEKIKVTAILLIAGLFYVVFLVLVSLWAVKPPRTPLFLSPQALGVEVEEVSFLSRGRRIRGWWLGRESPLGVAVLLHGYLMNRSEMASLAVALQRRGFGVLLFDFLGCGKSDAGWLTLGVDESLDVLSACRWCEEKVPGVPRVLVGSSMGGAAAVFALSREPRAGDALVLDSVFHRAIEASLGWWRFIGGLPGVLLLAPTCFFAGLWVRKNPWAIHVGKALKKVECPVLVVHGDQDLLVPVKDAQVNFEWANEPKRLILWEGAGHTEMKWLDLRRYVDEILEFLGETGVLKERC